MKVIIIGGGISGVFCAIELARRGNKVVILEKKDRILKKMLVTGNGRCNLTNMELSSDKYFEKKEFVSNAIEKFSNIDFINYLNTIGIYTTIENVNRVYPITLKAQSVVKELLDELYDLGVEIFCNNSVISIEKENKFVVKTNECSYESDKVVFAVGGSSTPNLGSDGKSYKVLEKLGHRITKIMPALTQIKLNSKYLKHLSGVKVVGNVKLINGKNVVEEDFGEILFTDYGVSGPPILNISRKVNFYKKGLKIKLSIINNVDDLSLMKNELYNRYYMLSHFDLDRWLSGIVDKKFIYYITDILGMKKETSLNIIDSSEFERLINILLESEFEVLGNRGFENSQVSVGGVATDDIDEKSFESKILDGLYVIGEVLDVDGMCGGYNIQWAVSSAMQAARSM
ncbi:aminoacetone oxidase family FAD-binding enzyme [Peptoniphilus sp. oral taxon 386]|uniref:NAD(P)/FAD-dependent oxidoreductase n=1 Tax=Peptoniphilus sp. oral taxon 386 TaxID=652713 RepID=UPI00031CE315|nr:aminoacetone oxidase family FAD-binding enzyme [Peptoniphilus sp. oral taxon 386]